MPKNQSNARGFRSLKQRRQKTTGPAKFLLAANCC